MVSSFEFPKKPLSNPKSQRGPICVSFWKSYRWSVRMTRIRVTSERGEIGVGGCLLGRGDIFRAGGCSPW